LQFISSPEFLKLSLSPTISDGVSRLGLETRLETHFCESRSLGFRSRHFEYAKKWHIKISIIQRFFVCCICR